MRQSRLATLPLPNPRQATSTEVVPTVGFSVEEFTKNNLSFTVFDMSGQGRYRNLWEHYYKEVGGVIFCIDSTDKIRMCVAKDELEALISNAGARGARAACARAGAPVGRVRRRARVGRAASAPAVDAGSAPAWPAELKNVPIVFFANKMDLPTALTPVRHNSRWARCGL